ncbi:MAG: ATP-dependent DNA helicase [Ruminococcaceae bacterium]|nr:ATP-dependent DNA helicase [Oscillospiraceae bacterium]
MIYDEEKKLLILDVKEAVSTARRGISTNTVFDEDEPRFSAMRLPEGYSKESIVKLSRELELSGYNFRIEGEALSFENNVLTVLFTTPTMREAKRRESEKQARGEAFMLGAMALSKGGSAEEILIIKTVYFSEESLETSTVEETVTRAKLYAFFDKCAEALTETARAEIERVTERLPTMKGVRFPYGKARDGQDEFIRAAYRAMAKGGRLYAAAPTGTGKTVSTIFPALRALGNKKCDKVFYLTPKQTTAIAAKECIELFTKAGVRARSIILIAKEKLCKRGSVCRESKKLCPACFSGKVAEAAMKLFDMGIPCVTPDDVSRIAAEFTVCPYELSLTYAELCDIVICDFNYLFDPQVYIRRFFTRYSSYAFLVDEAHNLAERAREMYSAEITADDISDTELLGDLSLLKAASLKARTLFEETLLPLLRDELIRDKDGILHGAYHSSNLPGEFYEIFGKLTAIAEDELYASFSAKDDEKDARISYIREYLYKIKKFNEAVLRFDTGFEILVFLDGDKLRAKIYCIDTGRVIDRCLNCGKSAVFFSGTLTPLGYYRTLLGGDNSSEMLEIDSPFVKEQLAVAVMDKITTRYSEREDSMLAVCRVIAATLSARRGNYMIFSPSFAYSEALANAFKKKYPKIKIISQKPNMTKAEKDSFLDEFSKTDGTYLAAFCVMGGIYSEGIDLVGDKLIGAIIVGIGMPSLSYEREAIAEYYQEKLDSGKEFAYLYPGMNRVLQAAGRVIRTEGDRGVIVLIDDRFRDPLYKKSAPKIWQGMSFFEDAKSLKEYLEEFWLEIDNEEK